MIGSPDLKPAYGEVLESQIRKTAEGMAHFAGSGPIGKHCKECAFKGYYRESGGHYVDGVWVPRQRKVQACEKFKRMTGRHGPNISGELEACKYFEQKPEQ